MNEEVISPSGRSSPDLATGWLMGLGGRQA